MNRYCDAKWFSTLNSLISNRLLETLTDSFSHPQLFHCLTTKLFQKSLLPFFVLHADVHSAPLQVNQGMSINVEG